MEQQFKPVNEQRLLQHAASPDPVAGIHDFNLQCQRVLRCTARFMVSTPGGLCFNAGARSWLEGLEAEHP